MERKLSVIQLINYFVLVMILIFSILTFLKMKLNSKFYEPNQKLEIMLLIEGFDLTPDQEKKASKLFDEIDEIQKQFPLLEDEEKKLRKMNKLFKKGEITEKELEKFKREKRERLFKQNRLYHQKYLDALNLFTKKQLEERMDRMLIKVVGEKLGRRVISIKRAKRDSLNRLNKEGSHEK